MKIRIIPTILTDGVTVVKGRNFDNWRTVGNAQATARLFGARDVDELMFLDVNARKKDSCISQDLISYFSEVLDIPFSVGGGISTIEQAHDCMRRGAEKIVLGTSAYEDLGLIRQIASEFGSQAVTVAIDIANDVSLSIRTHSGTKVVEMTACEFAELAVENGAGELLIQSISRDGTLDGFSPMGVTEISKLVNVPIVASGGIKSAEDAYFAVKTGASAVAIGALFQFTQNTPASIANKLSALGIPVRSR